MQPSPHPVKTARLQKGWRLVDLAAKVNRSAPLLSMIENGYSGRRETREAIAIALDTPVRALWPDHEEI